MLLDGPDVKKIPLIVSSVPVDWDYIGTVSDLHFHARFSGFTQNSTDGTLTPEMGWFVSHDQPQDSVKRLEFIRGGIQSLIEGHVEEASSPLLNKCAPWYLRISKLHSEREQIIKVKLDELQQVEEYLPCVESRQCFREEKELKIALMKRTLEKMAATGSNSTEDKMRSLVSNIVSTQE